MKRTLLIAAALTLAPLATASAQQGKAQVRVPARATLEAAQIQARPLVRVSADRVAGTRVVTVAGVRKQPKTRPAPRN
ncbi:MAG TPA: hypothetical protein VE913_12195 [Longimicrobium sp.]|nr:hypothetical protein [Longimicrobium sp.]